MIDALLLESIVFFLLLLFFLGFSLFYVSRIALSDHWFIRFLLSLGTGLGTLVFLIILFNVLHIRLDYRLFFFISLLCPFHYLFFHLQEFYSHLSFSYFRVSRKELLCFSLVVFATLMLGYTFLQGAFAYHYLEDDDPWEHAIAVKYIAEQKTYYQESGEAISHYLEPYPPSYDAVLALVYQINGSILLTLKVFNVLLITLGILFFFIFAYTLFDLEIALVATLVLVALPSWMSHFIWSHTLALVLFFPAFTLAIRGFFDSRFVIPAVILVAAMMVTHPFVSVLFVIFFISILIWYFYFIFFSAADKKSVFLTMNRFTRSFLIGFFGVVLSFLYWGQQLVRHGLQNVLYSHTGGFSGVASTGLETAADLYINPAYTLSDFFIAPLITKIDQPTGFGVVVFILTLCSIVYLFLNYKRYFVHDKYHFIVLFWLLITFIGLLGGHLPFSILTHRFWAYVSIPIALLVSIFVVAVFQKIYSHFVFIIFTLLVFFGIFGIPFFDAFNVYTSWYPKSVVETALWPPGIGWSSVQELEGYIWMHQNIVHSRVLSLCKEEKFLFGFDLETHFPNEDINEFRRNIAEKTKEEIIWKSTNYDYISLEYSCVRKGYLTDEQLNELANALASRFSVLFMNDAVVVYEKTG